MIQEHPVQIFRDAGGSFPGRVLQNTHGHYEAENRPFCPLSQSTLKVSTAVNLRYFSPSAQAVFSMPNYHWRDFPPVILERKSTMTPVFNKIIIITPIAVITTIHLKTLLDIKAFPGTYPFPNTDCTETHLFTQLYALLRVFPPEWCSALDPQQNIGKSAHIVLSAK